MLHRIKASYRMYHEYPPTSMDDIYRGLRQISVESPLSNSVASFRKWVIEDLGFKEIVSAEYVSPSPQDLERHGIALKFSRQPHQVYDPNNFVHDDQREFLSDDEILQYDEVIYIDCVFNITD